MDTSEDYDFRDTFWKKLRCWLFHGGIRIHNLSQRYTEESCYNGCYQKTYPLGEK